MARPLQKKRRGGRSYTRPPIVESAIDAAISQDQATLRARGAITDKDSRDFLASECLVYLIRDAWRRGDTNGMSALLPYLLARCEAVLKSKVAATLPNAEEIRENIISDFSLKFVEDIHEEDELDYFECCFNAAFRTFRIDFVRRERSRLKEFVLLPEEADSSDDRSDEEKFSRMSEAFVPATQESDVFRKELADAINA